MSKKPKIFILDTNVILHDSSCIHQFQENDVVIPLTVLEELDQFKRGSQVINLNAREFSRTLDSLTGQDIFNGGVSMGEGRGQLRIAISRGLSQEIREVFKEDTPDHRILGTALDWQKKYKDTNTVILVSKDVNLRMKAKALGIPAEDYTTDRIGSIEELYSGKQVIEDFDDDKIIELFQPPFEVPAEPLLDRLNGEALPNKYFILRNGNRSVLANLDQNKEHLRKVDKNVIYGITPRNAEQTFAVDALSNHNIQLVSLTGKAGTGKTLLALASALHVRKYYRQIFIARPIVPLSNKDIGYLPGSKEEKLTHWMEPIYDNLEYLLAQGTMEVKSKVDQLFKNGVIVLEALTYIRGRSIPKQFVIIDEAQNLTPHEIKTIISRAGIGTKMVLTGDPDQIDNPYLDASSNGLSYSIERLKNEALHGHIRFKKSERSPLASLAANLL